MLKTVSKLSTIVAILAMTTLFAQASKISAYYDAPYAPTKTVKSKLSKAGFKVLATYSPASKANQKVIVFTNKQLTAQASKKTRGFAAIQKVLVDSKAKTVRVTNPIYWSKAFMQKAYKAGTATSAKKSIEKALGKLTATKDVLNEDDLSGYHFMMAMPYYEDMIELKASTKVNSKNKIFELKLNNGSKLIGVTMGKSTESFVNKIGIDKSILLPYTILIEGGKAYALHPKYYIALSYPLLSMSGFMNIMNVPDVIETNLKKILK